MSLPGFDILRREHPAEQPIVQRLEEQIGATLLQDENAVIDYLILVQTTAASREQVGRFLAELVKLESLQVRWFWLCPNTEGTISEAARESDFPDVIECPHCGESHAYSLNDTEVQFLPSTTLVHAVRAMR